MSLEKYVVTLDELRAVDLQHVVNSCEKVSCLDLERELRKIDDCRGAALLAAACSINLVPENPHSPFAPRFIFDNYRGILPADLPEASMSSLKDFCQEVDIPELQARLADIIWVTKSGGIEYAHMAVIAYLDAAKSLLNNSKELIYSSQRTERALRLSTFFNDPSQRPDLFNDVSSFIIDEIENNQIDSNLHYILRLLKISYECGVGDNDWLGGTAEDIANNLFNNGDVRAALEAWDCARKVASSKRDNEKQREIWRNISLCHVKEAELHDGGLVAAGCLLRAIDALSKIPGTKAERLELYEDMRDCQIESLHQLQEFCSPPQDISEIIHQSKERVQGQDFFDMLFRLGVLVSKPVDMQKLRDNATKEMHNSISWMFGATHIDHEGITTAKVPPSSGVNGDKDEEIIWSIMMRNMGIEHKIAVQGQIQPAINEITTRHCISETFLASILKSHPFIPTGHEEYFVKAIILGLQRDFLGSIHILVPQIENSLRHIARTQGEEPTSLHGDGSQERNGLKVILKQEAILNALGKDIVGNLQSILIDKIYGDLRNQMSHGYVPSGYFHGPAPIFIWWLILHILMVPFSKYWKENYQKE